MTRHISPNDLKLVGTEPRVLDLSLASALDLADPHKIRNLIKRNTQELTRYGEVSAMVAETSPAGGRPSLAYWLNEPQSMLICMFSEGAKAADVREEIIRVFMDWRAQQADRPAPAPDPLSEFPSADGPLAEHMAKLATLRECRMIHGARAAARLWKRLGLPQVSESVLEEMDEGRRCLLHLLGTVAIPSVNGSEERTLRHALEAAMDGVDNAQQALRNNFGLLAVTNDPEGLFVPNCLIHKHLFAGTPWAAGRHVAALRRLAGTQPQRRTVIGQDRGTFIPYTLIEALPVPADSGGNVVPLR
ncbi:hypothetical protein [Rhodopseudomonas sp. AAP120]|uniref:hypothetical protein n=1 Tax=Rhodopseudomonas sp. AAP120 TaxID=1523430 RepID=UPI000A5EF710|nr:hypothetical protein [Rhodopseudomonas sp. AAP120]